MNVGRRRFKHHAAIVFSISALLLGGLFGFNAMHFHERSRLEPTTRDQRLFRRDAIRFGSCSALLVVAAMWYGWIGIRGETTR